MTSAPASTLTSAVVLADGSTLYPSTIAVTLDETWAPFVVATFTTPAASVDLAALDARYFPRARVMVRRAWAQITTLADLTEAFTGLTLANLTTEYAGLRLADLSTGFLEEWESGARGPDDLYADLVVRERSIDRQTGLVTVTLASDELLLQHARLVLSRPAELLVDRLVAIIGQAIPGARFDLHPTANFVVEPAVLDLTNDVWDHVSGLANALGMRLMCDVDRTWRLVDPTAAPTEVKDLPRVSSAVDATNLDSGYSDALAVVMTGPIQDPANPGQTITVTDAKVWPSDLDTTTPHVWRVETVILPAGAPAGAGLPLPSDLEMGARLATLQRQGRTASITAPADPSLRPGHGLALGAPSLPTATADVAAVTFTVPEDTMRITAVDVQDA